VEVALLNLRGGPSTDFPVVGQAPSGTALPITGRDPKRPDWWQVGYEEENAWVYGSLVATGGPIEQVPLVEGAALPTDGAAMLAAPLPAGGLDPLPDPAMQPLLPYLSR
jgi:hypothetical protein